MRDGDVERARERHTDREIKRWSGRERERKLSLTKLQTSKEGRFDGGCSRVLPGRERET